MSFIDLKNSNFFEIIKYLELIDLASLSAACKFFNNFFINNKDFIQKQALSLLGIEYSPLMLPWKRILLNLYNSSDTKLQNLFQPFYTNGGTYEDLGSYFIWILVQDEGTHCTHLQENVLVKYIFSPNIKPNTNEKPIKYMISEDVFNLHNLEESANENQRLCPDIRKIFIKVPLSGFTSPCEILMCFSSLKKIENFSLIQNFHSCKTKEDAIKNGEILKLSARIIEGNEHEAVIFKNSIGEIQPICWVKINFEKCSSNGFWIETGDSFFGRYFYVLLISARRFSSDTNIDISNVTPWSRVIEIGNT
ncbi:hypothetical protein SteCoe_4876 [Stentor coeruleus]|uniref:F-box domain-containing protein n=1 Tax=Stentor coeruleus TaxID=5963 RepID=A0A1R2CTP5_9CILI|nr:hypothetical protein SteCoe_4876 [Stentor coeruleus]